MQVADERCEARLEPRQACVCVLGAQQQQSLRRRALAARCGQPDGRQKRSEARGTTAEPFQALDGKATRQAGLHDGAEVCGPHGATQHEQRARHRVRHDAHRVRLRGRTAGGALQRPAGRGRRGVQRGRQILRQAPAEPERELACRAVRRARAPEEVVRRVLREERAQRLGVREPRQVRIGGPCGREPLLDGEGAPEREHEHGALDVGVLVGGLCGLARRSPAVRVAALRYVRVGQLHAGGGARRLGDIREAHTHKVEALLLSALQRGRQHVDAAPRVEADDTHRRLHFGAHGALAQVAGRLAGHLGRQRLGARHRHVQRRRPTRQRRQRLRRLDAHHRPHDAFRVGVGGLHVAERRVLQERTNVAQQVTAGASRLAVRERDDGFARVRQAGLCGGQRRGDDTERARLGRRARRLRQRQHPPKQLDRVERRHAVAVVDGHREHHNVVGRAAVGRHARHRRTERHGRMEQRLPGPARLGDAQRLLDLAAKATIALLCRLLDRRRRLRRRGRRRGSLGRRRRRGTSTGLGAVGAGVVALAREFGSRRQAERGG
mmetsp:Transcript_26619/g.92517  ORF Transcript_26619/g.92517 Transcript_26619/m.92517 type:complete len:551 (-) Transcript_26619:130-1782(-)